MTNHPNRSKQQQAKHTPGPWRVRSVPQQISGDEGDKQWWYSFEAKADKGTFAEHEANAAIMQSAPKIAAERDRLKSLNAELLAALKNLIAASDHMSPFGTEASVANVRKAGKYMAALDKANTVIAKAERR